MRIDEFSRNDLTESHATMQELTSQIQELQERMIYIWMILENFKIQNRFVVEKILTFSQSPGNRSKSTIHLEPRPKHATSI